MDIAWDQLDEAAWAALADRAGVVPLQQGWGYGVAAAALGAVVRRAVILDEGGPVALAQLLDRRGLRLISRGPLWLSPCAPGVRRAVLRRLARTARLTVATAEHPLAGCGLVPLVTPRHHAIWDLSPAPAALLAAMRGSWRTALRAAERPRPTLGLDRPGTLDALLLAEERQRRARGYRALPAAFTRALPPGALRVWDWREGGETQAAMAFVRHGATASYHLGWTGPAGRAGEAHRALLWAAALALRSDGVRWLDLGDVNAEDSPGLARFKLGTGAALQRLGPTAWVLPG